MDSIRYAVLPFGPPPVVAAIVLAKNGRPIAIVTGQDYDPTELGKMIALANLGQSEINKRAGGLADDTGEWPVVEVDVR